jgi:hypothetical protein
VPAAIAVSGFTHAAAGRAGRPYGLSGNTVVNHSAGQDRREYRTQPHGASRRRAPANGRPVTHRLRTFDRIARIHAGHDRSARQHRVHPMARRALGAGDCVTGPPRRTVHTSQRSSADSPATLMPCAADEPLSWAWAGPITLTKKRRDSNSRAFLGSWTGARLAPSTRPIERFAETGLGVLESD